MTYTQYLALQMLKKCRFPSYFYFQLLPPYCPSDISAWTSPKYLKFKRFQTKLLIHLTSLHTLLLLPKYFSPRLSQFSKRHHQPTRHSDAHASNVVILDAFLFSLVPSPTNPSASLALYIWDIFFRSVHFFPSSLPPA